MKSTLGLQRMMKQIENGAVPVFVDLEGKGLRDYMKGVKVITIPKNHLTDFLNEVQELLSKEEKPKMVVIDTITKGEV